jgi:hypothetical protein
MDIARIVREQRELAVADDFVQLFKAATASSDAMRKALEDLRKAELASYRAFDR